MNRVSPEAIALFNRELAQAGVRERLTGDVTFGNRGDTLAARAIDRDGNTTNLVINKQGGIYKSVFCSDNSRLAVCRDIKEVEAFRIGSLHPDKVKELRRALHVPEQAPAAAKPKGPQRL